MYFLCRLQPTCALCRTVHMLRQRQAFNVTCHRAHILPTQNRLSATCEHEWKLHDKACDFTWGYEVLCLVLNVQCKLTKVIFLIFLFSATAGMKSFYNLYQLNLHVNCIHSAHDDPKKRKISLCPHLHVYPFPPPPPPKNPGPITVHKSHLSRP